MTSHDSPSPKAHYSPPWNNVTIIGIAGSSGSGKSSLSRAILSSLNLPWVAIVGLDSFYKPLNEADHAKAHRNELDLDAPGAIDFDLLVEQLQDLKHGYFVKRTPIPAYLEDVRAKSPICLFFTNLELELVLRDIAERGRDAEGCIKQWFAFVKPNFERYVEPQRKVADIIVPRGIENTVAITMVTQYIERKLIEKSKAHRAELKKLGSDCENEPLASSVSVLEQTSQLKGISTIIQDVDTSAEDFIFYFDRIAALLIEHALNNSNFRSKMIETPTKHVYNGYQRNGEPSAVVILRAGAAFETGLKRVIPDCKTGRILIQSNIRTGEPELHYQKLPVGIQNQDSILLLDPQMSSGGAALMSVQVLIDHGVAEDRIVFVTYFAGKMGLNRLTKVFPRVKVVVCEIVADYEPRWIEKRYFRC
ncbi:hypothetical protein V493_02598 [Pseudogymnoascus sp. VKM F-4281 (FW-2241)]|nr:hypothetical protein V493_02598 [Pseudogymnoascus sp. VKM F-4281 (FW-2241)]